LQADQPVGILSENGQGNGNFYQDVHATVFYLFAAELCNALPECRDKGPTGVAQVGVELLLVMGRQMGPPTAQPEKKETAQRKMWAIIHGQISVVSCSGKQTSY